MSDTSRHYTIHCAIPSPCTKLKRSCRPPGVPRWEPNSTSRRRAHRAMALAENSWKSRTFSTRRHDAVRTPERRDALVARHAPPRVRAAGAGILLEPATLADASPCLWRLPRRPGMRTSEALNAAPYGAQRQIGGQWDSACLERLHDQLPGLRSGRTSGERWNYRLAELAHRALDALMVEVAEAHLAEQMAHAGIAQLGDLIGHLARGADQRAGA